MRFDYHGSRVGRYGPVSTYALTSRYVLFAVIATAANLLVQRLVLFTVVFMPLLQDLAYVVYVGALGAGTIAGLLLKYILDKKWIFGDRSTGIEAHGKRFSLYVLMGVVTTAIFWGTETLCWWLFHSTVSRELGGVMGLSIGYLIKYRLDRRFVFSTS